MQTKKSTDLRSGLVRILNTKNKTTVGTGFFCNSNGLIATCLHVIDDAAIAPYADKVLVYCIAADIRAECSIERTSIKLDIALLQWPKNLDIYNVVKPFRLCESEIVIGHKCETFGFPGGMEMKGTPGRLIVLNRTVIKNTPVIAFRSPEVTAGFSGAPVFHPDTDCVAGVITHVLPPDYLRRGLETGYFVPAEELSNIHTRIPVVTQSSLLLDAWSSWTRNKLILRYKEFSDRTNNLVSPAMQKEWKDFRNTEEWSNQLKLQIDECINRCQSISDTESDFLSPVIEFEAQLDKIDLSLNYEIIVTELAEFFRRRPLEIISQLRRKHELKRVSPQLGALNHELRTLQEVSRNPFKKCFLILGNLGEGKTHFLCSLLRDSLREISSDRAAIIDCLFLPIHASRWSSVDVSAAILSEINNASKHVWNNLDEFLNAISVLLPKTKVVIILDDFDEWVDINSNYLCQLIDQIKQSTYQHNLLWMIMVNHARYPIVREEKKNIGFWSRYGNGSSMGWYVMDEANRREKVGIHMLQDYWHQKKLGDHIIEELQILETREDVFRHLCSPFVASVAIDIPIRPVHLVDLHFVDFVRKFLEMRIERLDISRLSQSVIRSEAQSLIETAIDGIAISIAKTAKFNPEINDVIDEIRKIGYWQMNDNFIPECLRILHKSALIEIITYTEEAARFDIPQNKEHVEIRYPMVWEYLIASRLLKKLVLAQNSHSVIDILTTWMECVAEKKNIEGVLEYIILLVDSERLKYPFIWCALEQMISEVLEKGSIAGPAIWFAATKASKEYQRALIEHKYGRLNSDLVEVDTCFAVLYFAAQLEPSEIELWERIRFIQPYFTVIGNSSLASYLLYIVDTRVAAHPVNSIIFQALSYFNGCESTGVSREIANIIVTGIVRNAGLTVLSGDILECQRRRNWEETSKVLKLVIQYMEDITEEIADSELALAQDSEDWERNLFRRWFLNDLLHEMARSNGVRLYFLLKEADWYGDNNMQICERVRNDMAKSANFALADYYRKGACHKEKEAYVALVTALADSQSPKEREIAFFLVLHTVPTGRNRAVKVDASFQYALLSIWESGEPKWILSHYEKMFHKNLRIARR